MKFKSAIASLLVVLPLAVSADPQSASGVIRFSGQIVESGCEVGRVGARDAGTLRQVELKPGLTIGVSTFRNACSGEVLPFSITYDALKTSTDKGIVILSYL
ncbi:type 1 fimbrial protein [Pseudomonas sp. SWRI153]|uniref:Type 1 fimbrial protein n=1 Tax=Pseudomonas khorasanensis TaxID=2745508 RepID=A0A923F377_9PSED|nr:type 1 fimbrial protein [Pseudomonas khorasanensis]MBV4485210.1 type 1 fimbrial protein [Pseudomonas khorasanensis]